MNILVKLLQTVTRFLTSMEPYLVVAVFVLFGGMFCKDTLTFENTGYCVCSEFESPQVNELIGNRYINSEFDFNQEYGWILELAGKYVRKRI